jgi:hypothetical protein
MHFHVSEIFEDLRKKLNVTLCMGDFVLGCEKVKDRTDVLRGPGIVAFFYLVSND